MILIYSNPQPWGHPTSDFLPEYQGLPEDVRERLMKDVEEVLGEMQANGELVGGEALGGPASSTLYWWRDGSPLAVDWPYSEAKEHLAGFFLIDVESRERAEEIVVKFSGPGETVELRPVVVSGDSDQ